MLTNLPRITPPEAGQEQQVGSRQRFTAPAADLMCTRQSTKCDFGLHCFFFQPALFLGCRFLLLLATLGRGGAKTYLQIIMHEGVKLCCLPKLQ